MGGSQWITTSRTRGVRGRRHFLQRIHRSSCDQTTRSRRRRDEVRRQCRRRPGLSRDHPHSNLVFETSLSLLVDLARRRLIPPAIRRRCIRAPPRHSRRVHAYELNDRSVRRRRFEFDRLANERSYFVSDVPMSQCLFDYGFHPAERVSDVATMDRGLQSR